MESESLIEWGLEIPRDYVIEMEERYAYQFTKRTESKYY